MHVSDGVASNSWRPEMASTYLEHVDHPSAWRGSARGDDAGLGTEQIGDPLSRMVQ